MAARREIPKLATALLSGSAAAAAVVILQVLGAFIPWELKARDVRTRWTLPHERRPGDPFVRPDVFFVMVDDDDLRTMNDRHKMTWPWDRDVYGVFLQACKRGKAATVLFDLLLQEAGEGDDELVAALKTSPPVYSAAAFWEKEKLREKAKPKPRPDEEELLARFAVAVDTDGSVEIPDRYGLVYLPAPKVAAAMKGVCDISTLRDADGMIRRYRLLSKYRDRYYPTFVLAALLARENADCVVIRRRVLSVGAFSVPLEGDGTVGIRYYPPRDSFALRSALTVMGALDEASPKGPAVFDLKSLDGKVVIFGTRASGLTDLRVTPVDDSMPGPAIHGIVLANLLNGDFLREAPEWLNLLLSALLALGAALATRFAPAAVGGACAVGILAASGRVNVALYKAHWVVALVPQIAAIVLAYAATSAVNFLYEGRQRLRVKREFQRYLSPRVVEKILKNPDALSLEGERKTLTVFFMDFAGFTSMSEKLDPTELVKLISEYHNEAAEEIFRTEGTIDKYIGDAIMAFWNDPIGQPDHALRACLSAVGAQKRLKGLAGAMRDRGLPEMRARIGINTGIATVGNMGAQGQVNYTVIGDEVNLASRLEGVNKEFGTEIIVSEATYVPSRERLEARELALIRVKGKRQPVRIYELLGLRGEVPAERLEKARTFEGGLAQLRARSFHPAWQVFLSLSQNGDRAAEVYVGLCERYMNEPPPADWDGSYQMETK